MSLLDRLHAAADSRKRNAAVLSRFFLKERLSIENMTLEEVARHCEVSVSTTIRFIRYLGYDTYADFKEDIFDSLRGIEETSQWFKQRSPKGTTVEILKQIVHSEVSVLERLLAEFDEANYEKFQLLLSEQDRVFVLGQQSSASMARSFVYEPGKVRRDVFLIDSMSDVSSHLISYSSERDLTVVFGFPRYPRNILNAVKSLKRHGCKVVSLTNSKRSPFVDYSDVWLQIYLEYYSFTTGYAPIMALLNLIIIDYCHRNYEKAKDRMREFELSNKAHKVFVSDL